MNLRQLLDICQVGHADDWVLIPGNRPATAMMAGVFDPGFEDARTRPLAGHSIAVYEPNPAVSMVWPIPEDDAETERRSGHAEGFRFEWDEERKRFKNVRAGYVVIALGGAPVWQTLIWYLDWGSGIGGYIANFSPIFDENLTPEHPEAVTGWEASAWEIRLAGLVNSFSHTARDWAVQDPTDKVVTRRLEAHPLDLAREGY
jgi:hypothetical protein